MSLLMTIQMDLREAILARGNTSLTEEEKNYFEQTKTALTIVKGQYYTITEPTESNFGKKNSTKPKKVADITDDDIKAVLKRLMK